MGIQLVGIRDAGNPPAEDDPRPFRFHPGVAEGSPWNGFLFTMPFRLR